MIQAGLPVAFAMRLYEEEILSLGKAAQLARLPPEAFIEKLGAAGIPVVRYDPQELDSELAALG